MRRKKVVWIAAATAAGALALNAARLQVGGVHNLFSRSYWAARIKGTDLYEPNGAILKHGNRSEGEVALTFDDGPHPQSLPVILDALHREHVKATFFLVGKRIKEHPEYARALVTEGHEVGNHTYDHFRLTDLTDKQVENEIVNCETVFERATGRKMTLLRPPGMRFDHRILGITERLGYQTVGWTDAAKDFDSLSNHLGKVTPNELADRVLKRVENGSIILLHDTPQTAEAIDQIIRRVEEEGFKFVTVTQMLSHLPKPVVVAANPRTSAHASKPVRA